MTATRPTVNLTIQRVDIDLLRKQRDWLLTLPETPENKGLTNLLDVMLDVADGGPGARLGSATVSA